MTISSPRKGYSPASALKRALGALEDAEDFRGSKECLAPCAEIDTYFSAMDPFAREGLLASTKDMKMRKKIADVYAKQCKILLQQKEHILAQRSAENYALWRGDSGKSTLSKFVATITESIVKSMHGESHDDTNRSLNIFTVFSGTTSSAESSPDTNSPDTNSPDTNSPDTNSPDIKSSDTKSPVTKSPVTNSPDTNSSDTVEEITITERSISVTERSIAIEHTINPVSKTPEASLASNNPRSRPIRTGSKASLLRAGSDVKLKYKPPSSPMTMSNGDPSTSTSSNTLVSPYQIFLLNSGRPIVDVPVPELCSRFDNTTQLAFCANLLKSPPPSSFSSGGIVADIGPEWQSWKASAEEAEGEKDRILELVQDVVVKFINDTIKGSEALAEVLLLGPVLDRPLYRRLLTCLITEFEGAKLLNATQLRALIKLVQSASIDYLDPDDLVRILAILRTRLQATHTQSIHPIVLAWAVSRVLDVMVEGSKVMDLNRIRDHKPLSDLLAEFSSNSNPYLKHQVLYASQALLYIPDDETRWQYTKRHVGRITMGLLGIASVCKLDLGKFEEGVDHLWEALGDAHEVAVKMVGGVESMVESGQGVLKSIRDTFRLRAKRLWYAALQEAEECVRDGRLADFNRLVFETFCRRDVEFRWGVCLILDGIVFDPRWGTATRQQAIDLLGVLYRNETDWKRDDGINRGILNILRHAANLDVAEIEIHALNLVQSLETDGDAAKRAFYKVCMSDHLRPLLSEDPFANEPSSKLLSQAQGIPKVEDQLLKLQKQRLKGYDDALYIPPQARANLKSSDGSKAPLFPLMDKIMAFLSSDQLVFLLQGDSGAGKSTFSRQLEYSLWKNYKKGGPIPLHINLPVIDKPEENMIAKQLKIYDFTPDQIRELKTKRHFILICDGYDEGQININLHTRNRLNQEGEWRAKLVISCRTQYLGADYRGRFQPGEGHYSRSNIDLFQQAILAAFSKAQIQMYVLQYVYKEKPLWTAENFMDKLSRIPHLMDLVSNPFLLTLTLKALPNLVGSQDDLESIAVTRVELYDNFVDSWLGSGKKRLEYCLAREARASFQGLLDEGFESGGIAFAKELATDIYKEQGGLPVVQYMESTDGQSWKAKFFGPGSRKEHLRDSLPLLRNGKQRRFLHHSLLDYFYSRVFFDPRQYDDDDDEDPDEEEQTINNRGLGISNHKLNHLDIIRHHAVLDFLAERVNKHPNFANLLHAMVETSKKDKSVFTAAANAITILVKAGVRFNGQNLQGIAIPGADLSGGEFDWTDFQGADLSKVNFTRTWLRQADLRKATLTKVQFGELPFLMEDDQVWSCAYSPDGKTLATGCRNGVISIYSTATWKKLHILQKSTAPVHGLAFSPNNQQLASACDDNMVHLWSVKFGNLQSTLQGHTNGVRCVAYSPDGRHIASGSMDKTTIIWDSLGMKSCTLEGHVDGVRGLSYSPNGENIATASADNTVRLWNVKSRSSVIIGRHSKQVMAISFSPTGLQIASGCSDGVIGFWNVGSRVHEPAPIFKRHIGEVRSLAYSPDGRQLASGSQDLAIGVWDTRTGDAIYCLDGHSKGVYCLRYSPSGENIASASLDGNVRLWNTFSYSSATSYHKKAVSVAFSQDGSSVLSAIDDGVLCLRDAQASHSRAVYRGHNSRVLHAVFFPDGSRIVSVSNDKTVQLWDTVTKESLHVLKGHDSGVTCVAVAPNGCRIASGSLDRTVCLWNSESGERERVLEGHSSRVNCVAFSPKGNQLASGSADKTIVLWNIELGERVLVIRDLVDPVLSIEFSPDGQRIVYCCSDTSIRDTTGGTVFGTLNSKGAKIATAAYSPSGELIATGGYDNNLRIWDVKSLECLLVVRGVAGNTNSVSWSLVDHQLRLATVSSEGIVYQWEVVKNYDVGANAEGRYWIRLVWGSRRQGLYLEGMRTQGAVGLSPIISELFKQRVTGVSASVKKNKKKKKTGGGS